MELLKIRWRDWLLAIPFALILSLQIDGCDMTPAPATATAIGALVASENERALLEVNELEEVYARMTPEERARGIVLEPIY